MLLFPGVPSFASVRNGATRVFFLTAVLTPILACSNGPADAGGMFAGVWSTRASLPTARQEMPSAHVAGRIYTPGGYDSAGQTSAVLEVYDVASDRASAAPPMPEGRNHPGVAASGASVYVIGGYTAAGSASSSVFAFHTASSACTSRRPLPAPCPTG